MNNSDMPAMPVFNSAGQPSNVEGEEWLDTPTIGLTKREYFCLHLGLPETGCDELDDLIVKANVNNVITTTVNNNIQLQDEG